MRTSCYVSLDREGEKVVKVIPSLPSVGLGADPGVQAVSRQVTFSHPPGGRLSLLSARPAVTSVAFTRWRQVRYGSLLVYRSFDPKG